MAIQKETFKNMLQISKISALLLLPFLLSMISLDNMDGRRSVCLVKNLFEIECYGCGITKAVISSIQLEFTRAFKYNRLIVIVMPLIVYLGAVELLKSVNSLKKSRLVN